MPDDEDIFEKAVLLASSILKYDVSLVSVDPRRTSSIHNSCGGSLKRTTKSYDIVKCNKCSKQVNTHTNAALNIRDRGIKSSNSPFRMRGVWIKIPSSLSKQYNLDSFIALRW